LRNEGKCHDFSMHFWTRKQDGTVGLSIFITLF
jgi:hypothetical protein